jgi:hypothetical protein
MQASSATHRTRQEYEQDKGRQGNHQRRQALSFCGTIANGFLTHHFLPLYEPAKALPMREKIESSFYASLEIMQSALPIKTMDVSDIPYPYNVLLSYWDAERQLQHLKETELFIVNDGSGQAKFCTIETVDTHRTLYYIPVLPLHRLIKSGKNRQSADLLLAVCAYLYHCAGVPYYRDDDSYLCYYYEMLEEDLNNEWNELDEDDIARNRSFLRMASHLGDKMQKRIYNVRHLNEFGLRLARACPKNDFQRDCLKVAEDAYGLWQEYPEAHLFRNAARFGRDEDSDDDEPSVTLMEEYFHFVAEADGALYQSLAEMVNCDIRERFYTQEPTMRTVFDKHTCTEENLDYERRLITLINDLCTILNDLP